MSEQPSSGRPLLPGQIASWLRYVCFAAAALVVTGYVYLSVRKAPNAEAERRQAQKALRSENAKKGQALLTEPGRNADGTYRIPVKDAAALIAADNKVVAKIQAAAAPAPAAAPAAPAAVGAFVTTGVLVAASGLFEPLGRLVAAIPKPIANAMLAGVLILTVLRQTS